MRVLIFLACTALLLYGLLRPESPPNLFNNSDKLLHLLAFGGFSLTTRLVFLRVPGWLLWAVLLLCAPLSEWLQHTLQPARQFSWFDIYANWAGVVLAAIGWWVVCWLYGRWQARQAD